MSLRKPIIETALLFLSASLAFPQNNPNPGVNRDSLIGSDFEQRVASYMKIHQQAQAGLTTPKKTESADKITEYQRELAAKIRELRPQAQQGDIFTPETADLFRRLIASSLNGPDGEKIRKSYQHAEPAAIRGIRLEVNQIYPDGVPLQSMPPSLLLNLPSLPKELEYRFVGREIVLLDVPASLIVDAIPDVTTPEKR